ncbi:MAG: hypothetical protein CMO01_27250 [Thalassobius sp.]|nr:hypothetical protein [Thalassovita sp.]
MAKKVFAKSKILNAAIQQKTTSEDHIKNNLVINDDLKAFIRALSDEEYKQLEANILEEGCKDALIVWNNNGEYVLVDGHNRYRICKEHKLDFKIIQKDFDDLDQVKDYMVKIQLGRRNLTQEEISYYRGLRYETEKNRTGNIQNLRQNSTEKDKMSPSVNTAEKLANEYGVNEKTIKRDAKYTQGLNKLSPVLRQEVLKGKTNIKKQEVQSLAGLKTIKNESIDSVDVLQKQLKGKKTPVKGNDITFMQKEIINKLNQAVKTRDKILIKEVKKELNALEKMF